MWMIQVSSASSPYRVVYRSGAPVVSCLRANDALQRPSPRSQPEPRVRVQFEVPIVSAWRVVLRPKAEVGAGGLTAKATAQRVGGAEAAHGRRQGEGRGAFVRSAPTASARGFALAPRRHLVTSRFPWASRGDGDVSGCLWTLVLVWVAGLPSWSCEGLSRR